MDRIPAKQAGLSYAILEKGPTMQGIIDTYPKGKEVYPTIPKSYTAPFPVDEVRPPDSRVPVEAYIHQARAAEAEHKLNSPWPSAATSPTIWGSMERRHSNLIYTAVLDAKVVIDLLTTGENIKEQHRRVTPSN